MNTKVLAQMTKMMVFVLSVFIAGVFTSCDKNEELLQTPQVMNQVESQHDDPTLTSEEFRSLAGFQAMEAIPRIGHRRNTKFDFMVVSRNSSSNLKVWVRLVNKGHGGGARTILMETTDGIVYTKKTRMASNGWFDYWYLVGTSTSDRKPINKEPYTLCSTYNILSEKVESCITWPFGADGSSWSNRAGLNGQLWKGGQEQKEQEEETGIKIAGRGYGYEEGTHSKDRPRERYSDDWNRGRGDQDLGAEIRSPLDGYVEAVSTYPTEYGPSKYVSIIQEAEDGNFYRFYVGHLDTQTVKPGQYVNAGETVIGTLGQTGAKSPHAHCNLRLMGKRGEARHLSVPFYFGAEN